MGVIIDDSFQSSYDRLMRDMPQSTLLHGPRGVGLKTIALNLCTLFSDIQLIEPSLLSKTSSTRAISIQTVRSLYESVRSYSQRVIIIDDADLMTVPAQHALLKLLEEPNSSTTFLLTSHRPDQLLPTIRSRLSAFYVPIVKDMQLGTLTTEPIPLIKQRQIQFIAAGRPAELTRLLNDEAYFRRQADVLRRAKFVAEAAPYDVLSEIIRAKFDRTQTLQFIEQLIIMLENDSSPRSLERIAGLIAAHERITAGGSTKLQLASAML